MDSAKAVPAMRGRQPCDADTGLWTTHPELRQLLLAPAANSAPQVCAAAISSRLAPSSVVAARSCLTDSAAYPSNSPGDGSSR